MPAQYARVRGKPWTTVEASRSDKLNMQLPLSSHPHLLFDVAPPSPPFAAVIDVSSSPSRCRPMPPASSSGGPCRSQPPLDALLYSSTNDRAATSATSRRHYSSESVTMLPSPSRLQPPFLMFAGTASSFSRRPGHFLLSHRRRRSTVEFFF